ncbi:ATP11 protein-domain-containing protein [Xylariaceae sp. FL0255]|nr:ATP11 protein-domain-containing protein [Xylariaceae sp. FL0255]
MSTTAVARLPATLSGARLASLPRHIIQPSSRKIQQRRWAAVHDVRFLATTRAPRNVAEKYREKLDQKARDEGLGDLDELKAAYADRIRELKQKDSISVPGLDALLADEEPPPQKQSQQPRSTTTATTTETVQTTPPPSATSKSSKSASGASTIKPLSEILDLPKARALPLKELSAIWRLHHASNNNSLCAVISTPTYDALERTARAHPRFVLPVPRPEQGAEMHFLQWVFDPASRTSTVLFTQLAEFKARGEWAQPHCSVTHYADPEGLSDVRNQGVVLMAGSVVENRGASVQDAQFLIMLLQRFYGAEGLGGTGGDAGKRALLESFTRGDGNFSVEKLLEESEKLA